MKMKKWLIFTVERFHPLSHFPMILTFVIAHQSLANFDDFNFKELLVLFTFTSLFFFKLRLYDEIKDYEVDLKINPTRPLARGLLTRRDIFIAIAVVLLLELIILISFFSNWFIFGLVPIIYSLLMFKEFFIGSKIRPHLTTYAVTHTFVSLLLSLLLFILFSDETLSNLPHDFIGFSIASWMLFNIFEFGRKTFAKSEERENVESYSKIWGRTGATGLVLTQAVICVKLFSNLLVVMQLRAALMAGFVFLLLTSLAYIKFNSTKWAKIYRNSSSVFILFVYLLFTTQYLMRIL